MLEYKLKDFIGYKANETINNLFFLLNNNAHYRNSYERRLVHVNYNGTEFSLKQWKAATSCGDDGTFTFFINLVDGYFAKNSLSDIHYPIGDLSMDEMFKVILENN